MSNFAEGIYLLLSGILAVTAIDTVGSITSRKWNYNYAYLSPLSFLVYALLGYFGHRLLGNMTWALVIPAMVGIYDGTVGWKISSVLDANFGKYKEGNAKMSLSDRIIAMIGIAFLFALVGYHMYRWLGSY